MPASAPLWNLAVLSVLVRPARAGALPRPGSGQRAQRAPTGRAIDNRLFKAQPDRGVVGDLGAAYLHGAADVVVRFDQ